LSAKSLASKGRSLSDGAVDRVLVAIAAPQNGQFARRSKLTVDALGGISCKDLQNRSKRDLDVF
jgi:hypothetical protein